MKSISLVNSTAIRNHPTNSSTSKNAYQFSKQQRFPNYNPQCKIAFYSNDSQLSNRKTSFGYGSKVNFTKTTAYSPSPDNYNIKSTFQINKEKGKSFGLSRQVSPDRSYLVPQLHKFPGPQKYQNDKDKNNNPKFSMRRRTIDFIQAKLTYKNSPGPGSYKQVDLDPADGRFTISKFSDAKFSKINPKAQRFETIKQTPGPLSYVRPDNLSRQGRYIESNHRGNGTRAFTHTAKMNFTDKFSKSAKNLPGPGYYEKPSQFGVYGDSKYYKTMRQ